ncbi:hypothetical protein BC936DRAFT_140457 [Jimgerdemannia flammicorona]|uniref:Uncharacterized protein n=1 Tax=Jimgerdemannia flammicorona TaxID=994334 RepID=A0A433ATW0_9FUNG|nr:hypothetical protein BC936DRAFT_140457 [Jimgerdemannia flammicorona]
MTEQTLHRVNIRADVYHLLLAHALSTEKEEVMGMLLGDWIVSSYCIACLAIHRSSSQSDIATHQDLPGGLCSNAHVESISILTRSDKRKDRVEIAPEQLHLAAIHAESNQIQITCFQAKCESPYDIGPLIRVETPLAIIPASPLAPDTIETLCELPQKVYEEQRREYIASLARVTYDGTECGNAERESTDETGRWMVVDGETHGWVWS